MSVLDYAAVSPRRLLERLVAPLRANPALAVTFVMLWVVTLVPIWRPRFLPLLDLPNHLDAIAIWHRYDDPAWGYSKFYRLNLLPLPYWGYFFPVHMLSYVMPIEIANKVYLSAYALFLPLGALTLARQMGRSPWLCVFVFPLVFNMNFQLGFITFCGGMTLLLYALIVLDRFLQAPSRGRGVALLLITTALYTTHVLPWLFFGVAAACFLFCHGLKWRRMIAAALLMLPSVALGIFAFRASRDGSTHVKAGPLEYQATFETITSAIEQAIHRVLATWPASLPFYLIVAFGVLWLFVMSSSRPDPATAPSEVAPPSGFRYRLELLAVLSVIATIGLPMHLFKPVDLWMIGGRFVAVTVLFLVLLPRGPIVGPGSGLRGILLVGVVLVHVVYVNRLTKQWIEFDRRAASFRRLAKRIPRGSSTLTLTLGELTDPAIETQAVPYVQFHSYAQFFGGGFNPWALNTGFPMVQKPGTALPAPTWKQPHQFRFDVHGIYYDYVFVRGESRDHQIFGPNDAALAPMEGQDGDWRLYKVMEPNRSPPVPEPKPEDRRPGEPRSYGPDPTDDGQPDNPDPVGPGR